MEVNINNTLITLGYNSINGYRDGMTKALSSYEEKAVNRDGSINYIEVKTSYFLENDEWHISFFGGVPQFKEQVDNHKYGSENISFPFNNPNINKKIKFIVYNKLFSEEWGLITISVTRKHHIKRLSEFLDEKTS